MILNLLGRELIQQVLEARAKRGTSGFSRGAKAAQAQLEAHFRLDGKQFFGNTPH